MEILSRLVFKRLQHHECIVCTEEGLVCSRGLADRVVDEADKPDDVGQVQAVP